MLSQKDLDELAVIFLDYRDYKLTLNEAFTLCSQIFNNTCYAISPTPDIQSCLIKYKKGNCLLDDCLKSLSPSVSNTKKIPSINPIAQQIINQLPNAPFPTSMGIFGLNLSNTTVVIDRLSSDQKRVLNAASCDTPDDFKTLMSIVVDSKLIHACSLTIDPTYSGLKTWSVDFVFAGTFIVNQDFMMVGLDNPNEILLTIHQRLMNTYNISPFSQPAYSINFDCQFRTNVRYDFNTGMFICK